MNKFHFIPQKYNFKKLSRENTPNNKITNKSIELPSPKAKKNKKRNTRTNSYNSYNLYHKTDANQKNLNYLMNLNKKIKSNSKEKETQNINIHNFNKMNHGIPFHKKKNNSLKCLEIENHLDKQINNINNENNLQQSYLITSSNLNLNFNILGNNEIKKNHDSKKNNYLTNLNDNSSDISSLRNNINNNKLKLSEEQIKFKIKDINNQISNLIDKANKNEKDYIFIELEKNYNLIISHQNQEFQDNIIKTLLNDNKFIKEQNEQLNKKFETIENKMEDIIKENKSLKKDLANKDIEIKDLQSSMSYFLLQFKNIQNSNNSKKTNNEEEDSIISLGDNININYGNLKNKQIISSNDSEKTRPSSKLNFEKNKQ